MPKLNLSSDKHLIQRNELVNCFKNPTQWQWQYQILNTENDSPVGDIASGSQ